MEIIAPHKIKSKRVTTKDIFWVLKDASDMQPLCLKPLLFMGGAFAIAHAQVNEKNPLRFFVMRDGRIISNPKIINHTKTTVDSEERCLSFAYMRNPKVVQRWNVVEVEYDSISGSIEVDDDGKIIEEKSKYYLEKKKERLNGFESRIFQHEINHMDGVYIYEDESDVKKNL